MMNNIIEKIQKETGYNFIRIMIMFYHDKLKYGISLQEFNDYKFYKIKKSLKHTFLTKKDNHKLIKKYNSKLENYKIKNRNILYSIFNEYIKREYFIIDDKNLLEFESFLKGKRQITVRKINGMESETISLSNVKTKQLYMTLFNTNVRLAEEHMLEHSEYNKFYLKNDFLITFIVINEQVVLKTMKAKGIHYNIEDGKFKNKKIPFLNELEELSIKMFKDLDNLNYLYFEYFVSTEGIELISINDNVPILQNSEALYNECGYKEKLKKYME